MHHAQIQFRSRNMLVMLGILTFAMNPGTGRADEPGIFGRFFRGGNSAPPARPNSSAPNGPGLPYGKPTATANALPSRFDGVPAPSPASGAVPEMVSTPQPDPAADQGDLPKLTPKSRVNRPITNAEPILTRFSLGRSNDGSQFAMFLEIFADGTVLDSEGIHHVRQADLKPVLEAIQGSDFSRIRGHSGAPPTDFIDHVQIIVFDRRLGRLTAHPFSYSGNPQGTDAAIRHLHVALEGLQLKLSRPGQPVIGAAPAGTSPNPAPGTFAPSPSSLSVPTGVSANTPVRSGPSNSIPLMAPPLPNPSAGPSIPSAGTITPPFTQRVSAR